VNLRLLAILCALLVGLILSEALHATDYLGGTLVLAYADDDDEDDDDDDDSGGGYRPSHSSHYASPAYSPRYGDYTPQRKSSHRRRVRKSRHVSHVKPQRVHQHASKRRASAHKMPHKKYAAHPKTRHSHTAKFAAVTKRHKTVHHPVSSRKRHGSSSAGKGLTKSHVHATRRVKRATPPIRIHKPKIKQGHHQLTPKPGKARAANRHRPNAGQPHESRHIPARHHYTAHGHKTVKPKSPVLSRKATRRQTVKVTHPAKLRPGQRHLGNRTQNNATVKHQNIRQKTAGTNTRNNKKFSKDVSNQKVTGRTRHPANLEHKYASLKRTHTAGGKADKTLAKGRAKVKPVGNIGNKASVPTRLGHPSKAPRPKRG
jgi:hypothetical protein